jgi:hypothetical protein
MLLASSSLLRRVRKLEKGSQIYGRLVITKACQRREVQTAVENEKPTCISLSQDSGRARMAGTCPN